VHAPPPAQYSVRVPVAPPAHASTPTGPTHQIPDAPRVPDAPSF
jgi:hypothetical protein